MWELSEVFEGRLSDRLKSALPGVGAQIRLSPTPINQERFTFKERPDAKSGAVLILFHPGVNGIHFPLIQRPEYPGHTADRLVSQVGSGKRLTET